MKSFFRGRLLASSLFVSAVALAGPAVAQTAPADDSSPETAADANDTIIVTGSRISRPTLDSPIPVTSLSAADLSRTGQTNIGDVLNDLPSMRSTFSQANSTQFIGTSGLNLLDLRGLGTSRTLVLVNGRRHITGSEGEFVVDTNTIPTDLIDRVDVVTGGSSAVYGSDAMAGVVNFVLKRNFEGVTINGQAGLSDRGDRGTYRLSATAGHNFGDGRGNISASFEYNRANPLYFTDRPGLTGAFSGRNQFQQVDSPALDNTVPDRTFLTGVRSFGYSNGGTFIPYVGQSIRSCADTAPGACLPNGFPRVYLFQPDGSLRESNYGVDFRPAGSGNNQGGDGATLTDTGVLDPGYKRYIGNILGHYEVSEAFKPFFEAKFVRIESQQASSPSFSQGGAQGGIGDEDALFTTSNTPISIDNPFLSPASRALITSLLPAGATYFNLNRNNVDLGSRGELNRRDTYRFVVGAEGTFNDDWHYDFSVNYGHLKTRNLSTNNRIEQNFYNAVDATTNAAGQIVCRINAVTVTDPLCAPLNILGNGRASRAALNYINTTSRRDGRASEFDITGNVVGDLSQLFELPGGPVRFAIGAEYRRETASYEYDALVTSGATLLNAIPPFNPPSFSVKEAYGELDIPLIKDKPFIQELSFNGAGRVAKYKGSVGTVFAYNGGAIFAPVRDVKFRVNYSRSVRAPTLGDLYSSPTQDFAEVDDPCDVNFIDKGKATRAANCAAAGVPAGFENFTTRAKRLEILSGGNPNLKQETSRSWTYGLVLQPRFIPGLSITADYYDIKISNVIASVSAQTIVDGCYDGASLDNSFCQLIYPRSADSTFAIPGLLQSSLNFAAEQAKGLDLDIAYNRRFDANNRLALRFIGSWVRTRTDFPYIDNPSQPERIKGELGDPIYSFNASADYTFKGLTVGYQLRFIGRQSITDWESQHTTYGVPPLDPYYADRVYYPRVFYHNIRAALDVNDRFSLYGGVDNVGNKRPPFGLTGTGDGDGIYDNIGRFMYVGFKVKV